MKSKDIRKRFLQYFQERGHQVVPSSSLVPKDPTVLLTLAGMLQFKSFFLGLEKPNYNRATSVQKCIRMNDIENVGKTSRHHTFFEMLGNFSFGDYFKKEAILFAWELLTKGFGLSKDKLWVAVFEKDFESYELWQKEIKLAGERIVKLGEDNNFWAAGTTGPCGPCSEIYYDFGEKLGCGKPGCKPGCDCERFLEIWNLVFIEFNRTEKGELLPLPSKNIDTGMGLERICRILEQAPSNFDTDLFRPIIDKIKHLTPQKDLPILSLRVIADHARAVTHLIADGVLPSNEGRGYVLRRLIRRAVLHGKFIGMEKPFLVDLAKEVIRNNGEIYPELMEHSTYVLKVLEVEEKNFRSTLDKGLDQVHQLFQACQESKKIPGEAAFKLHDTYGFPFDLTVEIAKENGFEVDRKGFEQEMERQREKARSAGINKEDLLAELRKQDLSRVKPTKFLGYEKEEIEARVVEIFPFQKVVVLDQTVFYPEGGGQIGDTGIVSVGEKGIRVTNALGSIEGVIFHVVDDVEDFKIGERVSVRFDIAKRKATAIHHTATHLLQAALVQVLGKQVKQAGSMVSPQRFRFDFTWLEPLAPEQVEKVESLVNHKIKEDFDVEVFFSSLEEAKKMGATALFNEKYKERVRVVKINEFSTELCGGTHVKRTGEIGFFRLISDSAVSAGIRRIEGVCGQEAKIQVMYEGKRYRDELNDLLKKYRFLQVEKERLGGSKFLETDIFEIAGTEIDNLSRAVDRKDSVSLRKFLQHLAGRLEWVTDRIKKVEKEIEVLKANKGWEEVAGFENQVEDIGGIPFYSKTLTSYPSHVLKELIDRIRLVIKTGIIVLAALNPDKVLFVASVSDDLTKRGGHAGHLVKILAEVVGGRGGGRPNLAEAGGPDKTKVNDAFARLKEYLNNAHSLS